MFNKTLEKRLESLKKQEQFVLSQKKEFRGNKLVEIRQAMVKVKQWDRELENKSIEKLLKANSEKENAINNNYLFEHKFYIGQYKKDLFLDEIDDNHYQLIVDILGKNASIQIHGDQIDKIWKTASIIENIPEIVQTLEMFYDSITEYTITKRFLESLLLKCEILDPEKIG